MEQRRNFVFTALQLKWILLIKKKVWNNCRVKALSKFALIKTSWRAIEQYL